MNLYLHSDNGIAPIKSDPLKHECNENLEETAFDHHTEVYMHVKISLKVEPHCLEPSYGQWSALVKTNDIKIENSQYVESITKFVKLSSI